jgi:DNA mismatch endonuclease (patch repair protein)
MSEKSQQRSEWMAKVRSSNTSPEIRLRSALHVEGVRFRLHVKGLPGTPDIVLPRYRLCIFVNGCFWHRHKNCKRASTPRTNVEFWTEKFDRNVKRDLAARKALRKIGWGVIVVWECQIKDAARAARLVLKRLERVGESGRRTR